MPTGLLRVPTRSESLTKRLGKATVDVRGQPVLFVLFDDGRATCVHVAAGAASVSSGHGHLSAWRHRTTPFTIHRCASCHRRYGP
jgi:hypothetical protein